VVVVLPADEESKQEQTEKPITQLCYWINPELWKKTEIVKDTNTFVIGSFQRDTEGSDLKTPKLEKGPDNFVRCVENINKTRAVSVLLGGWRRQYVMNELSKREIPFQLHELAPTDILNEMYDKLDLYVCGSRFEGGPQSILECAYKRVPVISTDVGIARDILHSDCILDIPNEWIIPTQEHIQYAYERSMNVMLQHQIKLFDNVIESVCKS